MKVLLPIDDSEHSRAAVEHVATHLWPRGTHVRIITVVHSRWPFLPDPSFTLAAAHVEEMRQKLEAAPELLQKAAARVRTNTSPDLVVTTEVLEGTPEEVIVQTAEEWGADLIVLGSHGYGRAAHAVLGSVAAAVFREAPCAVEIVRLGRPSVTTQRMRSDAGPERQHASASRAPAFEETK